MKVAIVGGGPAGLYFSILLKNQDPSHEVLLFERNAPNDTFGWGVVFSDKTLGYLKENDEPTYQRITETFATWDNVDIVYKSEKITVRGNKFSGIARIEILRILQERAAELGVQLRFREPVTDFEGLRSYDLVIGADGVNSELRKHYAAQFQPDLRTRPNKYIWYGTHKLFHGLTLTFRENVDGVFAAHSYKFNDRTSTFIIECDPVTWQRAGMDGKSEDDTRRYLQSVFAKDLGGEPLLSNRSMWINFLLVKNKNWSFENVVLLGDSLHTVHFSIGSGTKLALEDAIALNEAFKQYSDVREALAEFELKRRPIVDEYQAAAYESLTFFENLKDHVHKTPMAFAFDLMTRSKKVDYENLKRRDPLFIAEYERSLA